MIDIQEGIARARSFVCHNIQLFQRFKIEDLSTLEDPEYKYIEEKPATLLYDIDEMLNSPEYEYVDVVKSIPVEGNYFCLLITFFF